MVPWVFNIVSSHRWRCPPCFAHNDFFHNPFHNPRVLVYVNQVVNLHIAYSTLTFESPSTWHKCNGGMHCYIDGEASWICHRDKVWNILFQGFQHLHLKDFLEIPTWYFTHYSTCVCLCYRFNYMCKLFDIPHPCLVFILIVNISRKYFVIQCQFSQIYMHIHNEQKLMSIL
jgi:hypothetical protein